MAFADWNSSRGTDASLSQGGAQNSECAGVSPQILAGVLSAEDLAYAALRYGGLWTLVRRGLRKSLILPLAEARWGLDRSCFALLDDRFENLEHMLDKGIGLAMLAPSALCSSGSLTTFDLEQATSVIQNNHASKPEDRLVKFDAIKIEIASWQRTGLSTSDEEVHMFNRVRTAFRRLRQSI